MHYLVLIGSWLFMGLIMAWGVWVRCSSPFEPYRFYRNLFLVLLVLLGPLNYFIIFVPNSVLDEWGKKIRDWLDNKDNPNPFDRPYAY
jgi:hypothetical protein